MKKLVDDDRGRARSLLEAYPQLIGALIEVQVRPIQLILFPVLILIRVYFLHGRHLSGLIYSPFNRLLSTCRQHLSLSLFSLFLS